MKYGVMLGTASFRFVSDVKCGFWVDRHFTNYDEFTGNGYSRTRDIIVSSVSEKSG